MSSDLNSWYLDQPEPNQSCLLALRDLILHTYSGLSETRKYSMPCFILSNRAFCYLWIDKKSQNPYILFVDGQLMNHPSLQIGDRKRMKIFPVDPDKDIPVKAIVDCLKEALTLREKNA